MGRAVVVVFFVIGFFVFTFIKLAASGVKSAYNAVKDDDYTNSKFSKSPSGQTDPSNQAISTIDFLTSTLSMQTMLMGTGGTTLPDRSKDEWSIGYVGGYVDAMLQRQGKSLSSDAHYCMLVMSCVFARLFGEIEGEALFKKFISLQTERHEKNLAGQLAGGNDLEDFCASDGKSNPIGWSGYVLDVR